MKCIIRLVGGTYLKQGVEYFKIDSVKVDIKLGSIRLQFDNLFNGQKALETIGNQVINQNVASLSENVTPTVERGLEAKIMRVANQVFAKAPAREFFP